MPKSLTMSKQALRERALQLGGFDDDYDRYQDGRGGGKAMESASRGRDAFRRRAWLQLLDIDCPHDWPVEPAGHSPSQKTLATTTAAAKTNGALALQEKQHREAPELLSDEKYAQQLHEVLNGSAAFSLDEPSGALYGASASTSRSGHSPTASPGRGELEGADEEWQTVSSKRKTCRRAQEAVADGPGHAPIRSERTGVADASVGVTADGTGTTAEETDKSKSKSKQNGKSSEGKFRETYPNDDRNERANAPESVAQGNKNDASILFTAHPDEAQVTLDVRRSFTSFQRGPLAKDSAIREGRRAQLQEVIVHTLRSHPQLHYFQGYHDIVSVLLLTLSPEHPPVPSRIHVPAGQNDLSNSLPSSSASSSPSASMSSTSSRMLNGDSAAYFGDAWWPSSNDASLVKAAVARLSLHFIRDSFASTLDPVLGHLAVLRNVIRSAANSLTEEQKGTDQKAHDDVSTLPAQLGELAQLTERASPLPFFALSWVLTLFTHDAPSLQIRQRVLDFVLAHGPTSTIYLCVAVSVSTLQ
ncbi:hypothetical protein K437DRAFT_41858 [Tilletiaria anomala UBC 951]|uniref:Rab-GAP TBC domain-containing protein n=1 Tax=Tilletiaria anomala (strain ATCC 24038 / CBS 436.72 / UBC 951) TaxID=1037660 RepID=A0A066VAF6_TILAU|nr:uncharacterized protein K437DRAFT_41858 [Tilletiaria anomala UBC 951]KDN37268.1 hypothetical protein K437DRAFT_41858 [Tilletiaria anomala UBC 951]